MASCSESVTTDSQKTNSLSNRSDSQFDAEVNDTEIKGYLMKRARISRKWKRKWFLLKNCNLYYSESPQVGEVGLCQFIVICSNKCLMHDCSSETVRLYFVTLLLCTKTFCNRLCDVLLKQSPVQGRQSRFSACDVVLFFMLSDIRDCIKKINM